MLDAAPDRTAGHEMRAAEGEQEGSAQRSKGEREGPRAAVRGDRALMAVSIAAIVFLLLQILTYGHGRDQGIYTVVARTLLDGGMPYRDAFDFKPPGIFVVFAIARVLFGANPWGIRAVEVAGLVAMCFAMVALAERYWGDRRIGVLAAALAVLVHAQLDFWHTAQPESFGGMITVLALLAAEPRRAGDAPAWVGAPRSQASSAPALIAAGALFGAAGLLKPPLAGGGVVLALALTWPALTELRQRTRRDLRALIAALRPTLLIGVGGALPMLACAAWFAAKGALGDLYQVLFVFTPHYTALGWRDVSVLGLSWYGFSEWLLHYSGPLAFGLACLVVLRPEPGERWSVALLGGIIAVHLAGVVMQAKFFAYHYGATFPITAMLAALGLWKAWERCAARGPRAIAALVGAFLLTAFARSATKHVADDYIVRCAKRVALFAAGARDQAAIDRLASVADVNAGANREVAAFLRARVPAGRPVFVWGFEPVIYDLSGLPSATRYIYNVPQRAPWARDDARRELLRDLASQPPAAIVVERRDVFPGVTGDPLDSRDTLGNFPGLAGLIADRYALAATIEDFEIYVER